MAERETGTHTGIITLRDGSKVWITEDYDLVVQRIQIGREVAPPAPLIQVEMVMADDGELAESICHLDPAEVTNMWRC